MKIQKKKLVGVFEIKSEAHIDHRGFFVRLFDEKIFKDFGLDMKCVQESHSYTVKKHTVRGLHVSLPPSLEGKTIAATRGEVLWVIVDVRKNSKTFGQWDSTVISGKFHNVLYVPRGFAHGNLSLTDNCDLVLRADNYFSEKNGTGIVWNDKDLNIDWGLNDITPIIRERDEQYPTFNEFKIKYGGV